jgi:hypothetical protein
VAEPVRRGLRLRTLPGAGVAMHKVQMILDQTNTRYAFFRSESALFHIFLSCREALVRLGCFGRSPYERCRDSRVWDRRCGAVSNDPRSASLPNQTCHCLVPLAQSDICFRKKVCGLGMPVPPRTSGNQVNLSVTKSSATFEANSRTLDRGKERPLFS